MTAPSNESDRNRANRYRLALQQIANRGDGEPGYIAAGIAMRVLDGSSVIQAVRDVEEMAGWTPGEGRR